MKPALRLTVLVVIALLVGCATVSPDGYRADIEQLTDGKTGGVKATFTAPGTDTRQALADLLANLDGSK